MTKYIPKYIRAKNAKEAYIKRLRHYWTTKNYRNFNTNIGEIYEVDFGENVGTEFSGRHLAVCLNDTTAFEDRVLVIPITTKYEEYNLTDIVECESFVEGKTIKGGIVINEARFISKLRIFRYSNILEESVYDRRIAVGKIELTKEQLERFKKVNF